MTVSRTGTTPTPFGFVGASQYQTDSDSGLQLLGHRYYDPSIGRFLSQDPIQDGSNWYAYCDNNPLTSTDPEGLSFKLGGEQYYRNHGLKEHGRHLHRKSDDRRYDRDGNEVDHNDLPVKDQKHRVPKRFRQAFREGYDQEFPPVNNARVNPPLGPPGPRGNNPRGMRGWGSPRPYPSQPYPPEPVNPAPPIVGGIILVGVTIVIIIAVIGLVGCGGACFDGETPILMADGTTKSIRSVRPGDWVLSRDEQTGVTAPRKVLNVVETDVNESQALTFADGETIRTTAGHRFYMEGKGWIRAHDILSAMAVRTFSAASAKPVKSEYRFLTIHRVYNLKVEGSHTFFVGKKRLWVSDHN